MAAQETYPPGVASATSPDESEKLSFWQRLGQGLRNTPPEAWVALAAGIYQDRANYTAGPGIAAGLGAFMQTRAESQKEKKFKDWLQRSSAYTGLDPALADMVPSDQLAGAMLSAQLGGGAAKPYSSVGKIMADYQAGLISRETADALIAHETQGGGREPRAYQQSGAVRLADGRIAATRFNPDTGSYEYQTDTGWSDVPPEARPTTPSQGGALSASQFMKARQDLLQAQQAVQRITQYADTVGDLNVGMQRWADAISANVKTLLGSGKLNADELKLQIAKGQVQGLLGLFRQDIVGPGVMTEYDAVRVLNALGGDVTALQNPQVVSQLLRQLYNSKLQSIDILTEELQRSAPVFGADLPLYTPPALGDADGARNPSTQPGEKKRYRYDAQGNLIE